MDDLDDDMGGATALGALKIPDEDEPGVPILHVLSGGAAGTMLRVPEGRAVIGRSPAAQIRIEENGVSRNHASIRTDGTGRAWVEDLKSSNGTFLNGKTITTETQLRDGDKIQVGFATVLKLTFEKDFPETAQENSPDARDPQTTLIKHAFFVDRLGRELEFARKHQLSLAVLMVAVDQLPQIKASDGQAGADALFTAIAHLLRSTKRDGDVVARYDMDTFAILLRASGIRTAMGMADRIAQLVAGTAWPVGNRTVNATLSVGVAEFPTIVATSGSDLILAADQAMKRARSSGGSRTSE